MSEPATVARGFAEQMLVSEPIFVDSAQYNSFCEAVVSCVNAGVMVVSADGAITLMNPVMRSMLATGFPGGHEGRAGQAGEVYAADGKTRLTPDRLPSTRAMRGEEYSDVLVVVGPPEGPRLTLSTSARRLRTHDGTALGIVVVATDVTELSDAVIARDRFLATVSHELRTPMTSIIGYLELVLDEQTTLSPQDRAHLEVVRRNTRQLSRLVEQLLRVSSTNLGAPRRTSSPTDLAQVLHEAIESIRPAIDEAGLHLAFRPEATPAVRVDREEMAEVFDNLLGNAVKYTHRGGHIIARVSAQDGEILISISDDGPGVDVSERATIFEKFARGTIAEEHAVPGVGLGLSIVREAVEANGGRVEVTDSPAGGADFIVRIPR